LENAFEVKAISQNLNKMENLEKKNFTKELKKAKVKVNDDRHI
jgi:hypothetical protein